MDATGRQAGGRVMKSPFPGMDPFVEGHGHLWEDFHQHLIVSIKHVLADALPPTYVVQIQPRAYVHVTGEESDFNQRRFLPDVGDFSPGAPQAEDKLLT